ncbi:hypothetical protein GJ496_009877 [Pomphorhynchus laevis]|nr:hypothetical protein GJ496_009877 [Pomphorhynchus laevis]
MFKVLLVCLITSYPFTAKSFLDNNKESIGIYRTCKCGTSEGYHSENNMECQMNDGNSSTCRGQMCFRTWYSYRDNDQNGRFINVIGVTDGCVNFSNASPTAVLQRLLFCANRNIAEIRNCCDTGNLCNQNLMLSKQDYKWLKRNSVDYRFLLKSTILRNKIVTILLVCISLSTLPAFIASRMVWRQLTRKQKMKIYKYLSCLLDHFRISKVHGKAVAVSQKDKLHELREDISGSGSGSGLPLLVQRTIARQIRLVEVIGRGRFGEVWLGHWHDECVAVKIFSARDERSWFRETEIYQTVLNRHLNVLGFIAADNKDTGSWTQLWLVTDYHKNGSLYDYLCFNTVTLKTALNMMLTISTGLNHLHMPIEGYEWKPAIAHRDIKSKNILVKSDMTCCISDFGLAVKHDARTNQMNIMPNSKAGTNRYMSPEGLDGRLDEGSFESFKQADIYSFSLVLWEIFCRIHDESIHCYAAPYALPYHDYVSNDPTIEDMHKIVCIDRKRPTILAKWREVSHLQDILKIMEECWYDEASARLPTLRIKKCFSIIKQNIEKTEM